MKNICSFAGHSTLYNSDKIYKLVLSEIENLVLNENVTEFWVGNYGDFDKLCASAVRVLKENYPDIKLCLVIPYLTKEINEYKEEYYKKFNHILISDIPANTPKRFMISKNNEYMVKNSSHLVCYVEYDGGAKKTLNFALKNKNIKIINIAFIN